MLLAAERGKHVIVEKPMAISLSEASRVIEAAERHGVQLLCGGSRSSSAVVRKMRQVIVSGDLGRLHAMTTWSAEVPLTETRGAYAPECHDADGSKGGPKFSRASNNHFIWPSPNMPMFILL